MQLHSFSDAHLLHDDLTTQIKTILCDAIMQRGHAYLVVSGGKTPVELFKRLAKTTLPWEHVTITLADERCVDITDSERNERLVKEYLLQHDAQAAHFISLYDQKMPIIECMQTAEHHIGSLPRFDIVILGIGEDGHTASLFPCSDELRSGLEDPAAVLLVNPTTARHQRISLSKKRLLDSQVIFVHLIGHKKRTVFNQAMAERDPMVMPISAFLNDHHANVQVMYAP